jgi:hypothetical protein
MSQEFERYPALASWIERLGSASGLALGEWMVFVGSLNHALSEARQEGARGGEPVAWRLEEELTGTSFYDYKPDAEIDHKRFGGVLTPLYASPAEPSGWRPIKDTDGEFPLLVGREPDKYLYGPVAAFKDVTGVWRIHGSEGGMSRLQFEPTLVQDLPLPPTSEGGGA